MICTTEFLNPISSSTPASIHYHQASGNPDLYEFDNITVLTECDSLLLDSQGFISFFIFFGIVLFISSSVLIANTIRRK